MKTLEVTKDTSSLAEYAKNVDREPVIVTVDGKPIAALIPFGNTDMETVSLCTNPEFLALIERSRTKQKSEGSFSSDEIRQRLRSKKKKSLFLR